MDLEQFRSLDQAAQRQWVAQLILGQNARLRLGEEMDGPIGRFRNGKKFADSAEIDPNTFLPIGPVASVVQSINLRLTQQEILDGHPFIDFKLGQSNYLHLYEVTEITPFGEKKAGDMIYVKHNDHRFQVQLTQQLIDEATEFIVRFAVSE